MVATDSSSTRDPRLFPPRWWRFALWMAIGALLAACAAIALSVLFAFGMAVMSLFVGPLAVFAKLALSDPMIQALVITPIAAIAILYLLRPSLQHKRVAATFVERVAIAFSGVLFGVAGIAIAIASSYLAT